MDKWVDGSNISTCVLRRSASAEGVPIKRARDHSLLQTGCIHDVVENHQEGHWVG
jgi:hypothetical protein